jgi:hypothetical protein
LVRIFLLGADDMLAEVTKFFTKLDKINCLVDSSGIETFPFNCTPADFLEFAESDLKKGDIQAPANSLGHAKRAIDCQLDYFLKTYGLSKVSEKERWTTSKKISLLDSLGIVPESILHRVNKARNEFEHRYDLPNVLTAEISIDIVGLFIAATDLYLFPARYGTYFEISNQSENMPDKTKPIRLSDILKEPLNNDYVHLSLLQDDAILAETHISGISLEDTVSSVEDLNNYLYLLTFILHSHRIYGPNSQKFFEKLKYTRPNT